MKTNLTKSVRPADRLEIAHCTAAGVTVRDRRETRFISFTGRNVPDGKTWSPRAESFADREFTEGRNGRGLTSAVLPADFTL
jgi:hypothetical protein